ncbi:peptidase M28 [Pseudidiomarina salinarum]|uniref:Peptidase M28 n=1 Tax=Pseudidiomarina salinarum TaxID=435908 RepID=A0A094IUV8_9GAMM|nr:M28 family metallopeptidase [Pseudidiomarina salinarum]KFZ31465.1 peptidase M28 [Pseudidiomarina salinarum]RUO70774.1 peptidase M28 [Pseudidiomarina salinarum]
MRLPSVISFSLIITALSGCGGAAQSDENPPLSAEANALRGHLEFLASDELRGRDTGSRGHEIASKYIASEFKQLGLEPAGDNGSYFQRISFRSSTLKENTARLAISYGDEVVELDYPKEFLTAPSAYHEQVNISAPMVFVGYGLISDAFDINDYDGLDVSGKIVVTLAGRPESLPSEEGAHLNRNKAKFAAERGAVGMLSIHTPAREKVRPFKVSALYQRAPNVVWLNAEGEPNQKYKGFTNLGSVDTKAAENLFRQAPVDLTALLLQTENGESPRGFALNASVTLAKESVHEAISSPNVAAILPGTDAELKNEYVLYTAHSDHIGITKDMSQDDHINNGAMDNASGVAVMLETARMFAESAQAPKRSILFLAVTAEERGLLGADYYAHHPTVPINQIVANVNLDMPVLLYDFADVVAFGSTHSTLGDTVADAAGKFDIKLSADPMPEQAIFTRSDHYAFVKKGVPAVFLMTGFTAKDDDKNGAEIWGEFFEKHYHRPSDSPDLPINYDAGVVFTNINFAIGQQIANTDERPRWLPDSFFGQLND